MSNKDTLIKPIDRRLIDSIPLKNIISGEGSTRINQGIQNLCKEVLTISLNRTDGEKYNEVGILARLNDSKELLRMYGYYDADKGTCLIKSDDNYKYIELIESEADDSLVFVHNHPNNSNVSISDILKLYVDFPVKVVVAVYNDCSYVSYAMRSKSNISAYVKAYNLIMQKFLRNRKFDELYKDIKLNPNRYGLIVEMR